MKALTLKLLSLGLFLGVLASCSKDVDETIESIIPQTPVDSLTSGKVKTITVGNVSFDMVYVKGGRFIMGAQNINNSGQNYDADAFEDEKPTHQTTVNSYYIGKFEVTQGLWQTIMNGTPFANGNQWTEAEGLGSTYPAYYIEYDSIQLFITKLNQLSGLTFRLPTEAEWEYAARGGASVSSETPKFSGSNDIDSVAWYLGNSNNVLHAVGLKAANKIGIYDLSGNVSEWCSDWIGEYSSNQQTNPTGPATGDSKVLRGGNWQTNATACRITARNSSMPTIANGTKDRGFRLVLVP